jgi:hypothetical protein
MGRPNARMVTCSHDRVTGCLHLPPDGFSLRGVLLQWQHPPLAPSTARPACCGATAALLHTASLSPPTFYRWMCHRSSSPLPPPQIINSNLDPVTVTTARTKLSSSDAVTPPLPSHTTCMAPRFDTAVFSASDHGIWVASTTKIRRPGSWGRVITLLRDRRTLDLPI